MTFSIVAYDPAEQAWGVAVASKFLAAASVVAWAQAGAGAVATQAFAKVGFGPDGLALMASGLSAQDALAKLLANDPQAADRQVALVDSKGGVAAHTGADCFSWAGHRLGAGYSCQGNILVSQATIDAMAQAYESASGELATRLLAALWAGDQAGGDSRGRQAAGLLVVRPNGGYGGDNDRYLDLRVDDDLAPIPKLQAMLQLHHLYFGKADPASLLPLDKNIIKELQTMLVQYDFYKGPITGLWDTEWREAFWNFCAQENLEERADITYQGDQIDPVVLEYIRTRFADHA
jgi:uncharacterized Ntn-hydrolase superfamily protein